MTTTHTPGPWQLKKNMSSVGIFDSVGRHITRVPCVDQQSVRGEANARLIAAAPELLAALQALTSAVDQFTNAAHLGWPELDQARAALARAAQA